MIKKFTLLFAFLLSLNPLFAQEIVSDTVMAYHGHNQDIQVVSYSSKGDLIASAGLSGKILIHNVDTGYLVSSIDAHLVGINTLNFSRDGSYIISGSRDFSSKVFEVKTGKLLFTFTGHKNDVTSALIDPVFKFAFTGSLDGTIKVWNLGRFGEIQSTINCGAPINSICLSTNGQSIFAALDNGTIKEFSVVGKEKNTFSGHAGSVLGVNYSLNNRFLVSCGEDKKVIVWDPKSGEQIRVLEGHTWKVNSINISTDSKYALSGGNDGDIRLWEIETGNCLYIFRGFGNAIQSVAFQPNVKNFASTALVRGGKKENLVYVFNTRVGRVNDMEARAEEMKLKQDSINKAKEEQIKKKAEQDSLKKQKKVMPKR